MLSAVRLHHTDRKVFSRPFLPDGSLSMLYVFQRRAHSLETASICPWFFPAPPIPPAILQESGIPFNLFCERVVSYDRMAYVREPFSLPFLRFAAALGLVLGISLFYRRVLPVNPTTVALTFLLAILAVSTVWGIPVSVFMSIAAMLAFNYSSFRQ